MYSLPNETSLPKAFLKTGVPSLHTVTDAALLAGVARHAS